MRPGELRLRSMAARDQGTVTRVAVSPGPLHVRAGDTAENFSKARCPGQHLAS